MRLSTASGISASPAGIPHPESVRNIIFDFGGVICNIDFSLTIEKFKAFGPPAPENDLPEAEVNRRFYEVMEALETGKIPPEEFRRRIREHYKGRPSDEKIDAAWNALLLDIPEPRIRLLEQIRTTYRIFLLSNSNQIHYDHYLAPFQERFGYTDFDGLFEKAWFSFRMGMKKPDREIYEYVLSAHGLVPAETLFIDDLPVNVQAAVDAGMQGYVLKPGEEFGLLFV